MRLLVGFGANLGDPEDAFRRALAAVSRDHGIVSVSELYRTKAVGPRQPDFCNLAALLDVDVSPVELLETCRQLELDEGRQRSEEAVRWGPRCLDIDLLMAHVAVRRGPRLSLPHPRFHERAFALVPAAELAPDWVHPANGKTLSELSDQAVARDPGAILGRVSFDWR